MKRIYTLCALSIASGLFTFACGGSEPVPTPSTTTTTSGSGGDTTSTTSSSANGGSSADGGSSAGGSSAGGNAAGGSGGSAAASITGWEQQATPTETVRSLAFFNNDAGIAVGTNGYSAYTQNGGTTWTEQTSSSGEDISEVTITSGMNAIAVGDNGDRWFTDNGGMTWAGDTGSDSLTGIFRCVHHKVNTWAADNDGNVARREGPGSWAANDLGTYDFRVIYFINADTGFVAGDDGVLLKTVNGSAANVVDVVWNAPTDTPSEMSNTISDIHFIDANTGWAVGKEGKLFKTVDGGDNWTYVNNSGVTTWLYNIDAPTANDLWVVGGAGTLLHSDDGGSTWAGSGTDINVTVTDLLRALSFPSATTGYIGGKSGIFKSKTN